ncbi:hypothetical protein [Prauserella cavernicola]|uniref:Type VII secretion protein EccE n=1 Tax=Prauserella cavernicola TaxID=2800127 RepID=A0A934QYU9_9PSEU|nr:hypothetical protein [Prauserella cavernicola]MBK1789078.1 hypothetical protein [Prauserella cavernicola]
MTATATATPATPSTEQAQLPVLRIVCWQLSLVLVVTGLGTVWPVAAAGVVLLAASAARFRGEWLSTVAARLVRLSVRRRARDLPAQSGALALLESLAPGSRVRTAELAGTEAAVLSRPEELLTVLGPAGANPAELARTALTGSLLPEPAAPGPALRLRLVLHRGPRQQEPKVWLAVRAEREPAFPGDEDLGVALGNTVRRVSRRLRALRLTVAPLTEQELLATITALSHTGPGREALRENRRFWRAGPVTQAGIRVTGLAARPGREGLPVLESLVASVPAVACTAALDCAPGAPAVLRLAATTEHAVDAAVDQLARMAPALGVALERLDGRHAPALAATLPIGGSSA